MQGLCVNQKTVPLQGQLLKDFSHELRQLSLDQSQAGSHLLLTPAARTALIWAFCLFLMNKDNLELD